MTDSGKVIKFPKGKALHGRDDETQSEASSGDNLAIEIISRGFSGVMTLLFLVLFWLRGVVVSVLSFVSVVTLIAFLFALFFMPDGNKMTFACGIASFVSFVMAWAYDAILIRLSPEPMSRVV